jgi:hypothetical protein
VDDLDDIATSWLVHIDGLDVWSGQGPVEGKGQVKAHLRAWLQQYECAAAASAALATPDSNKVRSSQPPREGRAATRAKRRCTAGASGRGRGVRRHLR